jgi:2,4-diaminopentanoate dehydrogenase
LIINIIQIGLGPIGLGTVKQLLNHPKVHVVGAVDPAQDKAGRPLAELFPDGSAPKYATEIVVAPSLEKALSLCSEKPVTAVHTTGSFLNSVTSQIVELAENTLNVVSTTEELAYPWWHHPAEAKQIDEIAKKNNVTIFGTGVNPGFVMDLLPVVFSGVSASVDSVYVERIVDAGKRRDPLKKKVGAGITVDEFNKRKATGQFGHIGLAESVAMIGAAYGWTLKEISDDLKPKVADDHYDSPDVKVAPGDVLGIDQTAIGYSEDGKERIRLHLEMYVGARQPHDTVRLAGTPDMHVIVENGTPGDIATVSAAVNYVPLVTEAPAGLKTPLELPPPRWFGIH